MERETLQEWERPLSETHRLALGLDGEDRLWIAERNGVDIELGRPGEGIVRTVSAPLADEARPELGPPRLAGAEPVVARPEGLQLGERLEVRGRFEQYDGVLTACGPVLLASGTPEGGEPGTYLVHWAGGGEAPGRARLSGPATGVALYRDEERLGVAWTDGEGAHTGSLRLDSLDGDPVRPELVSYYAADDEVYAAPSVILDQTGLAYVLFAVYHRADDGALSPTREMQLNFERIAFKASAGAEGRRPVLAHHRRRLYMIYCAKPGSTTARWRVPGTTMWDGAHHIPGAFPEAVSDGQALYVATDRGLWSLAAGEADEGSDILHHSWASPDYEPSSSSVRRLSGRQYRIDAEDEPRGLLARLGRWLRR